MSSQENREIYLKCGDEEFVAIIGYKKNSIKHLITWLIILVTCGFLRLIFHWKPTWFIYCTHSPCSLNLADTFILKDQYKHLYVVKVKFLKPQSNELELTESDDFVTLPNENGEFERVPMVKYFKYKEHRYIWNDNITGKCKFKKLESLGNTLPCSFFHLQKGLNDLDVEKRTLLFDSNEIRVPVHSILRLLFYEVLNFFYVFQIFSVILWYTDEYEQYASVILIISIISVSVGVYQLRKNQKALYDTIHQTENTIVCRQGNENLIIPSKELVPGDVIIIPSAGCQMMCDAVLINGSCIVNESSLTGESIPVTKTALPNHTDAMYASSTHAKHTLYCGTKVIQTRFYGEEKIKAIVLKTGFMTQKGELVRSILHPKPVDFKFTEDAIKFILMLAVIAFCGFIYTIVIMHQRGEDISTMIKRALDLITITVPPALPAAMTVGIIYAQRRLKQRNIFCISSRFINISGSINCVCFDKTGTLTEEGIDVLGVIPVRDSKFSSIEIEIQDLPKSTLTSCLATCHSLTKIDNELCGDPLDLKMFEATGWELEEPEVADNNKFDIILPTVVRPRNKTINNDDDIGIVRQFTFSSSLQRMSVITRALTGSHFDLFVKGSPEMISSLSLPSSIPNDFNEVLNQYTIKGNRVIGLGYRKLSKMNYSKVQRIKRNDVECDLTFIGLLVMENRLKSKTKDTITVLHDANIRTIMITGDNILTALSVARECGMLKEKECCIEVNASKDFDTSSLPSLTFSNSSLGSENDELKITKESLSLALTNNKDNISKLAITGKSLEIIHKYYPEILNKLIHHGVVFARMSPEQKQFIIQSLQKSDFYVSMCGDGANDCGALKAAHAGISLSETEASIASPFTSKTNDISCVPSLICEGRAALVTSFGMFKYMAIYSICQFTSVLFLYYLSSNLTDWEYIYIDLFIITSLAALFGKTESYKKLSKRPPSLSLISATPIISLFIHILLIGAFQGIGYYFTSVQPWYLPHKPDISAEDEDITSYDNFAIFSISIFQYIGSCVIFSKGAPYRKSIFTNKLFVMMTLVLTGFSIYLVLYPAKEIAEHFELKVPPVLSFRAMLLLIAGANFMLSFLAEFFIIDYFLFKKFRVDEKFMFRKSPSKYNELEYVPQSGSVSPSDGTNSPSTILSPISPDSPLKSPFYPNLETSMMNLSDSFPQNIDDELVVVVSSPIPDETILSLEEDSNFTSNSHQLKDFSKL